MAKHNNLNIPASIMISGVESDTYFDIVVRKCGIRFILMSYHYLQKKPKDFLRKRMEEFPDLKIFIDSGAHTFLTNMDEYMDKPLSYWEKYVTDYTDWVKENNEYIFGCANLDLEPILGNEKIDELNDKYFLPVEEVGVEVCYVWHTPRGEDGWEEYCKKHSYVGMSMQNDATATVQKLMRRLNVARKYNTRVHGMALTKTEILVRVPFFTADSSVDGDSSILVKDLKNDRTERLTIAELYNRNLESEFRTTEYETRVPYENYKVLTVDNDNKVIWGDLYGVVKHKVKKPTVKISVESGKNITCTTDHSIITMDKNGKLIETKADELKVGDYVLTPRQFDISNELVPFTNVLIDKPNTQTGEPKNSGLPKSLAITDVIRTDAKHTTSVNKWKGDRISRKYEGVFHNKVSNSELVFLKIKNIEVVNDGTSEVEVYDLSVRDYERFFANGILVHNTTWLVGQQYGELNWFNGRKMQRLSKDQWRRQYKTQLLKEPFNADWDRLINGMGGQGDTYELLRLNVLAYILAEEHIRKRLHSKMYWMEEGVGVELVSLNSIVTPSKEWFDGECEDWKSYLEKLRLPTDNLEKDEAVNILSLFYIFVNDDYEELEEGYTEQELIDYAKLLGSESEDYQDSVEFMKEYFIDNATGKRNDFREVEMEEENSRAKERTSYIEDDVFDIIDLSEEQINNSLSLVAPKEMPEVDEYDEELRKNNIVPVRASDGKFLKGQKKVRRPKDIYSSKYPRINCTTCYKSGDCPEYRDGYVCAFDKMFKRFDTRNSEDVMDAMSSMINHNLERLQRAMMFEIMDGGMPTVEVTGLIDQNAKLLEKFQQIKQTNAQTVLQQRRTIMMDGTETIENSMSVNPQSGGILSKIFMSDFGTKEKDTKEDCEIIDVDYDSDKN